MALICGFCDGLVTDSPNGPGSVRAEDGDRVKPSGLGGLASAAHNYAGAPTDSADIIDTTRPCRCVCGYPATNTADPDEHTLAMMQIDDGQSHAMSCA